MKMKLFSLLLLLVTICVFSCQKEVNNDIIQPGGNDTTTTDPGTDPVVDSSNLIKGNWDFVSIDAKTESISEAAVAGTNQKVVTILNYFTTENSGSITIDDSSMTCTGIAYKVLSTIKTYHYKNDVLIDSTEQPYINTFPPTDSYTPYTLATQDSIFFKKGGFTNISAARFKVSPSAAKIVLDGDNLSFIQNVQQDTTELISGIQYHTVQTVNATLNFKKK